MAAAVSLIVGLRLGSCGSVQASFPASLSPAPTELRGRREEIRLGGGAGLKSWGAWPPFPNSLFRNSTTGTHGEGAEGPGWQHSFGRKCCCPAGGIFVRLWKSKVQLLSPGQITPPSLTTEGVLIQCESIH